MLSCSSSKPVVKMNDGFYIGKLNKDLIFNYTVLINIKDSIATLDAYIDEKGMITAYNIFSNKQMLPSSECFQIYKGDKEYMLSNSLNKVVIGLKKGSFMMEKPLKLKLKYKENLSNLFPLKKNALYCYCWLYPHVILSIEEEFNIHYKVYIQNRMELNLRDIEANLSYTDYFKMVRDSIAQYKIDFDEIIKK